MDKTEINANASIGAHAHGDGLSYVVYIAAASRSGSTLLAELLGNCRETVSVGEMRHLQKYMSSEPLPKSYVDPEGARKCSCGAALLDCEFWRRVELESGVSIAESKLKSNASRSTRRIIQGMYMIGGPILVRLVSKFFSSVHDELEVASRCFSLFEAACYIGNARVVIDSDKDMYHYLLLHVVNPHAIKLIFLTRDGRGVVSSETRGVRGKRFDLAHGTAVSQASKLWVRSMRKILILSQRTSTLSRIKIKYEDLCRQPKEIVGRICEGLDLSVNCDECLEVNKMQHGVGGSPGRFDFKGNVQLDTSWHNQLMEMDLIEFDKIGGKINRKLGYSAAGSHSSRKTRP